MNSILQLESVALVLLLAVSLVALLAHRLRVPYAVTLVLVGLALTFTRNFNAEVTPELILSLFIPPVAFEAAFNLDTRHLFDDLVPILGLSVAGVIVCTIVIAGLLSMLSLQLPLAVAAVFGALISATDPVAVVALVRAANIPRRLSVIIEAESLLNDGTAIVVFNIALAVVVANTFRLQDGLVDFVRVSAGGIAIGGILGLGVARLLAQIDDYLVETTLTTCLAFGSYLIADQLHTSGVLAVVAAGLLTGRLGTRGMSPTTKIVVSNFWEYIAFIANSLVFLLIGLRINVSEFANYAGPIIAAIAAVLLSRAIVVYGLSFLLRRSRAPLPLAWQHVLFWGGLRGAVSLALVLSLPAAFAQRSTLQVMTFGVVLFTLLIQATTMPLLLQRLGLTQLSPRQRERDLRIGRLFAAQAAWRRLVQLRGEGVFTAEVWAALSGQHRAEQKRLDQELHALYVDYGELERDIVLNARRESLRAERAALNDAVQRGLISDQAFRALITEVDQRLDALSLIADSPDDRNG